MVGVFGYLNRTMTGHSAPFLTQSSSLEFAATPLRLGSRPLQRAQANLTANLKAKPKAWRRSAFSGR